MLVCWPEPDGVNRSGGVRRGGDLGFGIKRPKGGGWKVLKSVEVVRGYSWEDGG